MNKMASFAEQAPTNEQNADEMFCVSAADDVNREEIYRIRHEVYARELQQHSANASASLSDSLDAGNVYLVAKVAGKIAGFVSVTPPGLPSYSIDKYFPRETLRFSVDDSLYEIRLLTVLKAHRGSDVAVVLMYAAFRWVESHGGSHVGGDRSPGDPRPLSQSWLAAGSANPRTVVRSLMICCTRRSLKSGQRFCLFVERSRGCKAEFGGN